MSATAATIPVPRVPTDRPTPDVMDLVPDVVALLERHGLAPEHGDTNWAVGYALVELDAFVAAVASAPAKETS